MCKCIQKYIYVHSVHIIFTSWSLEGKQQPQNDKGSDEGCILIYFGVVLCCLWGCFMLYPNLVSWTTRGTIDIISPVLHLIRAQASCGRFPGGLHNSCRHKYKWPWNRFEETVSSKRKKTVTLNLPIWQECNGFIPGSASQWDWLKKIPDSAQVSSGHSLNEMDWWFHAPKYKKNCDRSWVCFFLTMCPLVGGIGFRSIERGLQSSYVWVEISWPRWSESIASFSPSTVSLTWLRNTGGFALKRGTCEKKCLLPSSRWNCLMAPLSLALERDQRGNFQQNHRNIHMDIIWIMDWHVAKMFWCRIDLN